MSIRTGFAALVLVVLVAACSVPQAGIPAREPGPSEPPLSPASPLPTVASPAGLATIKACDLLTAQEASSLGMHPQGEAEEIISLRRCDWTTAVMRTQAEAAETAQRSMPAPVPYDPSKYQNRINSTSKFRALETVLAKPRLRGGQIVANARDRTGKRHRSRPMEWFDTEAGRWTARLQPAIDGGEHLTVAPADSARIATQVAEILNRLMR